MRKFFSLIFISLCTLAFSQAIAVADLLQAFEDNKVGAEAKYGSSPISVAGVIKSVGFDIMGVPYISITETGGDFEIIPAQFMFLKSDVPKLLGLAKGEKITVKGIFSSDMMSIVFKDSAIVEYLPSKATINHQKTISTQDLLALFEQNAIGADAAFRGKTVTVSGYVFNIDKDIVSKTPYIKISGENSEYSITGIRCLFPKGESVVSKIAKGTQVTLTGTVGKYLLDLELNDCSVK